LRLNGRELRLETGTRLATCFRWLNSYTVRVTREANMGARQLFRAQEGLVQWGGLFAAEIAAFDGELKPHLGLGGLGSPLSPRLCQIRAHRS
jgi:hypothetical protein